MGVSGRAVSSEVEGFVSPWSGSWGAGVLLLVLLFVVVGLKLGVCGRGVSNPSRNAAGVLGIEPGTEVVPFWWVWELDVLPFV